MGVGSCILLSLTGGMNWCLQLINEETGPTLERLKKERDSYIEYQKVVREIDHLNKLHIAWQVSIIFYCYNPIAEIVRVSWSLVDCVHAGHKANS